MISRRAFVSGVAVLVTSRTATAQPQGTRPRVGILAQDIRRRLSTITSAPGGSGAKPGLTNG